MSESLTPVSRRKRRTARGILTVLAGGAFGALFGAAPAFAAVTCVEAAADTGTLNIVIGTNEFVELRRLEGAVTDQASSFVFSANGGAFAACTNDATPVNINAIVVTGDAGGSELFIQGMGTAAVADPWGTAPRADYDYSGKTTSFDGLAGAGDTYVLQGRAASDSWTINDSGIVDINGGASLGQVSLANVEDRGYRGEHFLATTGAADTIDASATTATAVDHVIVGGFGDDVLTGGADDDTISAGPGNDTVNGNAGADVIDANAGNDTVNGGLGTDVVFPGSGDDTLNGGDADDHVRYDTVALPIAGGPLAWGGPGTAVPPATETLTSGVTLSLNIPLTPQVTGGAGTDAVVDFEDLTGTAFADVLTGSNTGANEIYGLAGDDIIEGLFGDDLLNGGPGTDWLSYRNGPVGCTVDLNIGTPQNTACASTDTIVLDGVGNSSFENLEGSEFGDTLLGDETDNVIRGRGGNDTINGRGGSDTADYTETTTDCTVTLMTPGVAQVTNCAGTDNLTAMENVATGSGNDTVTGDAGDNTITTGSGNDTVFGLGGADTINTGAGDDNIDGGLGSDTITGGDGTDRVWYDTATAAAQIELAYDARCGAGGAGVGGSSGGNGNDVFTDFIENATGTNFNDCIAGNAGNNDLDGLMGNDVMYGGSTSLSTSGNDNIDGDEGDDQIFGEDGRDLLFGGAGNDDIEGNDGDDTIDGQAGTDDNFGQDGNDLFFLVDAEGPDTFFGGFGSDTLCANTACGASATDTDGVLADLIAESLDGRAGALRDMENVHGGTGNDELLGNGVDNILTGDAGDDLLFGRSGDDSLVGGAGNDDAFGGADADTVLGGDGDDLLSGDSGNDFVSAGAGNDHVAGGSGDDVIRGGDGTEDLIDFGFEGDNSGVHANLTLGLATGDISGTDSVAGVEDIRGTLGPDVLRGDSNSNWIRGLRGNDRIDGLGGDDILDGNAGDDNVRGGADDDTMYGAAGNDLMNGGSGEDTIIGGTGRDTFRASDGEADFVDGRRGRDTAYVDGSDTTVGVEETH